MQFSVWMPTSVPSSMCAWTGGWNGGGWNGGGWNGEGWNGGGWNGGRWNGGWTLGWTFGDGAAKRSRTCGRKDEKI